MIIIGTMARIGNHILSLFMGVFILIFLSYGIYSIVDVYRIQHSAFLSDELLSLQPKGSQNKETFEQLQKINPDVKAWIHIDGTHINYPILQGKDELEYVNKDVHGEFSLSGSIFLSTQNHADFSDTYNLTYGHHMDNGGMYGDLDKMRRSSYFKKHSTGKLYLPNQTFKIELFAVVQCDAYDQKIYQVEQVMADIPQFQSYIQQKAIQYRSITLDQQTRLIALSTCDAEYTSGRTVVIGKLIM